MTMKLHILAYGLVLATTVAACSDEKKDSKEKEGVETVLPSLPNEVTVVPLEKRVFNHELISNGKVTAKDYADLYFRTAEVVAHVWVKNGDVVRKGQKIAELDLFKLNNTLAQQKNGLAQSTLEMQDVLIGQGYAPDNLKAVPADVLELAPFDGVVANLFEKEHNIPKTSEAFCRVINAGTMEVDFTVLESELPLIKVGDKVEVTPSTIKTGNVDNRVWSDRWMQEGDEVYFKGISNEKTRMTSRFVMPDNVFSLQSASVQYDLNTHYLQKWGIQNMRFSLNMSDLFYLSSVKRERGTSYPFARNVGLNISLLF